jgi:tetratricopeptide (TPR) repeat protein
MTPFSAIVLAALLQTAGAAPQQADAMLQRARVEYISGRFASAEQIYRDVFDQLPRGDQTLRAQALSGLGDVYSEREEYQKAEGAYSQALSLWKQLSDASNSALMLHNLGMLRAYQGKNDGGLTLLTLALGFVQSASPADPAVTAQVLNGIGMVQYRLDNNGKAEKSFNDALEIVRESNVTFNVAGVLNNLGAVYLRQRKYKQAEDLLNRALQIKEAQESPSDPDLIPELTTLGAIYTETGRYVDAEEKYKRSLKILEPRSLEFAPKIARVLYSLSRTYSKWHRKPESEMALSDAATIARENLNKGPEMVQIVEDYSVLLKIRGKTAEAADLHAQAKHARLAASLVVRSRP